MSSPLSPTLPAAQFWQRLPPRGRPPPPTWPSAYQSHVRQSPKHLVLLTDAGLVIPEPGERRRVRYRLDSAPVQVAQQFLAALAHNWDDRLEALKLHLDRSAAVVPQNSRSE
jgi:hypothetical protein